MEFNEEEVKLIYTVFETTIALLEMKKGHKSKNDIIALEQMKKITNKIDKYMEVK